VGIALNKGEAGVGDPFTGDLQTLRTAIATASPALPDDDLLQTMYGMSAL